MYLLLSLLHLLASCLLRACSIYPKNWVFGIWFPWLKTDFSKRFYRGCTWGEKTASLEWLWLIILIGIHSNSVQNAFGLFVFNGQRRCKNSDEDAVPTRKRRDSPSLEKIETISHLWVCAKMNSWKAEMSWTSKTPVLIFTFMILDYMLKFESSFR